VSDSATTAGVRLAYVVLAHERASQVAAHTQMLLNADPTGHVIVHYDLRSPAAEFAKLSAALAGHERAHLVADRVRCAWGMFGLVDGVVRALRVVRKCGLPCDYVYLLSSACVPIKPIAALKRFLSERQGMEFIEAEGPEWIVNGLREERYRFRHWFSFRTRRRLFDASWRIQRTLLLKRRLPKDLEFRFGSQWWCLTRKTCLAILDFIDQRPADYRFFRTTFIPDELFFQTLTASLTRRDRIFGRNLTFFRFTRKGRPVTFYEDHLELLQQLPYFFARKVSLTAATLRRRLELLAGAADDGQPLLGPPLSPALALNYDERVSHNVDFPKPGQAFYGDQRFAGWPSSLQAYQRAFCVLYGPPCITRLIREHLSSVAGITQIGRPFHPDEIHLLPASPEFAAFGTRDLAIRDMDRPLYLSRLLMRARGLPIIEMAPGDDNHAEWYLHRAPNVIFVACTPAAVGDEEWVRLYWMLAALDLTDNTVKRPTVARETENLERVRQRIDAYADAIWGQSHRKWVNNAILGPEASEQLVPLRWGGGERHRRIARRLLALRLRSVQRKFGADVRPLLLGLADIEPRLVTVPGPEMLAALPAQWAQLAQHIASSEHLRGDRRLTAVADRAARSELRTQAEGHRAPMPGA
jgi:hypothetical protein